MSPDNPRGHQVSGPYPPPQPPRRTVSQLGHAGARIPLVGVAARPMAASVSAVSVSGAAVLPLYAILAGVALVLLLVLARRSSTSARRGSASARAAEDAGMANRVDLLADLSPKAARRRAAAVRPSLRGANLRRVPSNEYGVPLGSAHGVPLLGSFEDSYLVVAPPRAGKSALLGGIVLDHPGPVLATSTRPDLVTWTAGPRGTRGPVYVFNPEGLGDGSMPSTLRWSPVAGCENPAVALERARALMRGAAGTAGVQDAAFWTGSQARLLPGLLNAAAAADKSLADVYAWIRDPLDDTPLRILERHPLAQHAWAQDLAQIVQGPDRTRDSIFQTLALTFSFMANPAVRHTVTPTPNEPAFDPHRFLAEGATLYLLGQDMGSAESGSIAPLFTAITSAVWEAARGSAAASPGGRLDPPLLLALDEVANICPVPLAQWSAQAGGSGTTLVAVVQSPSQLVSRWGPADARTVWNSCTVKGILGGLSLPEDLDDVSRLIGEAEIERITETHGVQHDQYGGGGGISGRAYPTTSYTTSTERVRVMPPERLRTLPEWHLVLIARRVRPVLARYTPVWDRPDVRAWQAAHPSGVPAVPPARTAAEAPTPEPLPDVWQRPRLEVVRDAEQQQRDAG